MNQSSASSSSTATIRKSGFSSAMLRMVVLWHWTSSAVCLIGMLGFAITGITLNHASQIETEPDRESLVETLPDEWVERLAASEQTERAPLPRELADWLSQRVGKSIGGRQADWSEFEIYLSMPGPGSDAWLAIDRETGEFEFESTQRGWISYANDLHKGRNTGAAWKWFLDLFAIATLVFCITGLLLLVEHARRRKMTWPLVGLGLLLPFLVAVLFIH
ncbi:PepSY-associated TM helix domain-containing protein [Rhodopirellula halodulae]|uniref:PepSY-associated TM helix domain-containing protein n=1 Tax=Rhodopirellula halodulae TaxID=2894198 RepID=UPI001E54E6E9|nr:PepSY-associated TM helix domain-containing protein [Rhodopirellula sp. JC737]MCC9656188.1 PepSY-associated TM helix domain-containing protein [Rhodopirellula sp. JC737]